jgi:hypothetical protein
MLFRVHKNTVRAWLKCGLKQIDNRRPILIQGCQLSSFLYARRNCARQRCGPGKFYCMRCRAPKPPVAQSADYLPITPNAGNLRGICLDCGTRIYRRVSLQKLATAAGDLQVRLPQAQQRIADSPSPSLNSNFDEVA